MTCVFCNEPENIHHLFFDCMVARQVWGVISNCAKMPTPESFSSFISFWKKKKCYDSIILVSAATLWLLRNEFVFQGRRWRSIRCVLDMVGKHIRQWKVLCADSQAVLLLRCLRLLDHHHRELLRIAWRVDDAGVVR